jgi:hypothetical protein
MGRIEKKGRTLSFWLIASATLVGACASAPGHEAPYEREVIGDGAAPAVQPVVRTPAPAAQDGGWCLIIATGCACDNENERVNCGTVHEQFGDYIRCSPAYRTCKDGIWGDCVGDRVAGQ